MGERTAIGRLAAAPLHSDRRSPYAAREAGETLPGSRGSSGRWLLARVCPPSGPCTRWRNRRLEEIVASFVASNRGPLADAHQIFQSSSPAACWWRGWYRSWTSVLSREKTQTTETSSPIAYTYLAGGLHRHKE